MKELKIWMNGHLVSQAEAVLPVNSAAVFYATNVFEGLRAYWNAEEEEIYAFRLQEHFMRLRESAKADFQAREGVKLTYLPFFAKAAIDALKSHPKLNANLDTEKGEVTYFDRENIAFAVHSFTPVCT